MPLLILLIVVFLIACIIKMVWSGGDAATRAYRKRQREQGKGPYHNGY